MKNRPHKKSNFTAKLKIFRIRWEVWLDRHIRLFGSTKWGRSLAKNGLRVFGILWLFIGVRSFAVDLIVWHHYQHLSILVAIFVSSFIPILIGAFFIFLARWLEKRPEYRFYAVAFLACIFLVLIGCFRAFGFVDFFNQLLDKFNIGGWGILGIAHKLITPASS